MDLFIVIILMIFFFFGFIFFLVDALVYIYSICTGTEFSSDDKVLLKFLAVCCVFIYFLLPISDTSDTDKDIPSSEKAVAAIENKKQYDDLEKIFISLNSKTTEDDLKEMIDNNKLPYNTKYFGGERRYIVAFEKEVTLYKKPGNHIKISFDINSLIKSGEYSKEGSSTSALYYNYGTWWYFREENPDNKYSGFSTLSMEEKIQG